jgi:hypothetical protein
MKINPSGWALLIFISILFIQLFTDIPIFPIFMGLVFAAIFGVLILVKFDIYPTFMNTPDKISKDLAEKIKKDLNIDNRKWKKFSRRKQWQMYIYSQKQEKLMKKRGNMVTDTIKIEVAKEWENLSLQERIDRIDKNYLKQIESEPGRLLRLNKKLIKEKKFTEKREKEKLLKEKQDKLIRQAEEKIKNEEKTKREEIEREKRKILEETQNRELLIERKKQKDIEYKELVKRQLLEKERRKHLESEAIQELIDLGKLSDNYSLQNNRVPIPSYIKEAVWKRDKQSCVNCGSQENLEFDHNIPYSKGGSNTINNIQILCLKCNRRKSNKIM